MGYYHYRGFGFLIQSEIRLPQLCECQPAAKADILVRLATSAERESPPPIEKAYGGDAASVYGNHPDLGWARTIGRDTLIIAPNHGVDPAQFVPFICGTYMGILIYLRGRFPLHAGGVMVGDKAVLLSGHSGAGKSTTTFALSQMGHIAVCDDIAALELGSGQQCWVHPGTRGVKLGQHLSDTFPNALHIANIDMGGSDKFFAQFDKVVFEKQTIAAVIIIEPSTDVSEVSLQRMAVSEVITALREHAFRGFVFEELLSDGKQHFKAYLSLAVRIPAYKVHRPLGERGRDFSAALARCVKAL